MRHSSNRASATSARAVAMALRFAGAFAIGASTVALVAPAIAQAPAAAPKAAKEFVVPYNEAQKAVQAKDFAGALAKLDQAEPFAKAPPEKLAIEQLRMIAYASTNDFAKLAGSLEAQLAIGGLPEEQTKKYKDNLWRIYNQLGQSDKALKGAKEFAAAYGGGAEVYSYLAGASVKANDRAGSLEYAQKAIEALKKEGKPADERLYNIVLKSQFDGGQMDAYYQTLETAAGLFPKEAYWKALVARAERAPNFKRTEAGVDVYRAFTAAKVALNADQARDYAEQATNRGLPIEAEAVLKTAIDGGALGGASDKDAAGSRKAYATAQTSAKNDRATLGQSEKEAATAKTGLVYVRTGESYLVMGDYAKAQELIRKGLDKGGLPASEQALAQLHLGIAQFRLGDKEAAKTTWASVKADNGAQELARAWTLLSAQG